MSSSVLESGTVLGHRYSVDRWLGSGALGSTYCARDLSDGQGRVALKVLAARGAGAEQLQVVIQQFSRIKRLRYSHLARIVEFGTVGGDGTPYLVGEFVDGTDLLQASEAWPAEQVLEAVLNVCRTLRYLHSRGVLHDDLKPSNLIVPRSADGSSRVKVVDFGIATWVAGVSPLTRALAYTAPEILMGGDATPRSDLYALGVVCYQLFARRLPFDDSDPGFLVQKQLQGRADMRILERLPSGAGLAQVLRTLLEKEPDRRPSSAEEVMRLFSAATGRDHISEDLEVEDEYFASGALVGRDRELALLRDRSNRVRETRRGWTVFFTGESGSGKSRLMEEFRLRALMEGWRVIEAACRPSDERSYAPFREILAKTAVLQPAGSSATEELFRFSERPQLPEDGSLQLGDQSAAGRFRDQLTREVVRRLAGMRTLLLLHDFHWADEANTAVLDYLTSDALAHPILTCVSVRKDGEIHASLARVMEQTARQLRGETVALEPLPVAAVRTLISDMLGDTVLAETLGAWIHPVSDGNPFFVEEILKHLVDRKLLRRHQRRWLLERDSLVSLPVPASIAIVLRQRLRQLSPDAFRMAQWLAVFRRPVPLGLAQELWENAPSATNPLLGELLSRQIIEQIEDQGDSIVRFRHGSIPEVLRGDLPGAERKRMHRRVAAVLERYYGDDQHQELAFHLVEGRAGSKAVSYALRAAAECRSEFASEAALYFYEFVLAHKRSIPKETAVNVAISAAELYCMLGQAKRAIRMLKGVLSRGCRRGNLASRILLQLSYAYQCGGSFGLSEKVAIDARNCVVRSAGTAEPLVKAAILRQLGFCAVAKAQPNRAMALLSQSLRLMTDEVQHPRRIAMIGLIHSTISTVCWIRGRLLDGVEASKLAIVSLNVANATHLLPNAYSHLGTNLTGLGRFRQAYEANSLALENSRRSRSMFLQTQALCNLVEGLARSGDLAMAKGLIQEMLELAEITENSGVIAAALLAAVETQIYCGELGEAFRLIRRLRSLPLSSIPIYTRAQVLLWCAWFQVETGDWRGAKLNLRRLVGLGTKQAPVYETELAEVLSARMLRLSGEPQQSIRLLRRVLWRLKGARRPFQRTLVELELAKSAMDLGDYQLGMKMARQALRLARAMPAKVSEAEAVLLMGQCECANEPYRHGGSGIDMLMRSVDLAKNTGAMDVLWRSHYAVAKCLENENLVRSGEHARLATEILRQSEVDRKRAGARVGVREQERALQYCAKVVQGLGMAELVSGWNDLAQVPAIWREISKVGLLAELDDIFAKAMSLVLQATKLERAFIFVDDGVGNAKCVQGRSESGELLKPGSIEMEIIDRVNTSGAPFISTRATTDPRLRRTGSELGSCVGSIICVPLQMSSRIRGVLYVDSRFEGSGFSDVGIDLVAGVARIVAMAVENERLRANCEIEEDADKDRAEAWQHGLVGTSLAVKRLWSRIERVARSPLDVLITGESGSGKELVARALHRLGRRGNGRFVALDCGALGEGLIESELFGVRRGAFTGAVENRVGLFEAANGGVLFLDEIGNLPLALQAKLLRAVETREVRRVGESEARRIDVQIVAAANCDLGSAVERGEFRRDLYFRLNMVEVCVPALRERLEDVPLLVDYFLRGIVEDSGLPKKRMSRDALRALRGYEYPGNVRELRNMVSAAYYLAPRSVIQISDLPGIVSRTGGDQLENGVGAEVIFDDIVIRGKSFQECVRKGFLGRRVGRGIARGVIELALARTGGKYRAALKLLGVPDEAYASTLMFLRRHTLYVDYRRFRKGAKSEEIQ